MGMRTNSAGLFPKCGAGMTQPAGLEHFGDFLSRVTGISVVLAVVYLHFATAALFADATAAVADGKIVMRNELLRVVIDPNAGARVVEYVFKPFGSQNLCFPARDNGGMLMDMFWQQRWPGELLKNRYKYEIIKPGPDEAVVRVWRLSTGIARQKKQPMLADIRMQRTIRLRAGERALHCRVSLANTADTGKLVGYWMQNNFYLLGHKDANQWYRPTIRGVDLISTTRGSPFYSFFVEAPTGGWVGVASRRLDGGVMLLMDYNELWKLYTNMWAVTTEWMYDRVAIPAGKAWETDVALVPTPGLSGYVYGSRHVIAQMQVAETPGGLKVTHTLTQGTEGLAGVTVTTGAKGMRGVWQSPRVVHRLDKIDVAPRKVVAQLSEVKTAPVVIEVEITGKTEDGKSISLRYADYHGGPAGINKDMVTLDPLHAFERPAKRKVFLKPDRIVKIKNDHLRVLFVRGLWHQYSGVDPAVKQIEGAEVIDCWYGQSDVGVSLSSFPPDYPTLMGYDVIVLANADGPCLGDIGQEMLADFVRAGGGVLVVSGDRTYGQAGFSNPRFMEMLPVKLRGPFDWRKLPRPATLRPQSNSPIAKDLRFDDKTVVLYSHVLAPAEGAGVAIRADESPMLLTAKRGKGRVAAILALPFGQPKRPQVGYWQAKQWYKAVKNTIEWLAGE